MDLTRFVSVDCARMGRVFFLNKFISAHDVVFLLFLSLLTGQKKKNKYVAGGRSFFFLPVTMLTRVLHWASLLPNEVT